MMTLIVMVVCALSVFAAIGVLLLVFLLPMMIVMTESVTWAEAYRRVWSDVFKD